MPWSVSDLPDSVKNKTWSAHQKEIFVHAANAALKEYGDDGKAIAVGTAAADYAEEKKNAAQYPQILYCRHMQPGVVWYEGSKAKGIEPEMVWIDADAMKQSIPSMAAKPVFVYHQSVPLNEVEDEADGYVIEAFYNELDGWLWAKFLITSDEAHEAIKKHWSVSNAYLPREWDGGGQHLNVDYNRKIRNYEFTHLAIVPNPRYEEAKIFTPEEYKAYQASKKKELEELHNSKPIKPENGIMFFRNNKQEIKAGDTILDTDFTEITNADGTKEVVTVGDLKKAKEEANKLAKEKENAKKNEKMVDDDEEVEVDGEKVNMGELKKCYTNMKKNSEKKNEETPEAKKAREELENAEAEEKKKAEEKAKEEEKENAKRFQEFLNAGGKSNTKPKNVETQQDKLKRGQDRY